jgi:hypothetical protein
MKNWYITLILLLITATIIEAQDCISGDCGNGYGVMTYSNGQKYIGEFDQGLHHGQGVLFINQSKKYVGSWKNGRKHGEGRIYLNNRILTTGNWKSNKLIKTSTYQNGCVDGNCQDGIGAYLFNDGKKVIGEFSNGVLKGYTICFYPNGDKYNGEWKFSGRNGQGTLFGEKNTQNGIWLDDAFVGASRGVGGKGCITGNCENGRGKYVYPDNTHYEGSFKNKKAEGYGICYFSDGDIYVGEWKKHTFHGEGTMYYSNGDNITGNWENGNYLKVKSKPKPQRMMDLAETEKFQPKNGKVWAVLVGIARYNHMRSLKYTDDDAYRLHAFFKSPEGGAIPDDQIRVLIDEDATKKTIEGTLKNIADKAGENDIIIFYFSGHGLQGSFLPHDYDGAKVVVNHNDIKEILEQSDAKAKMVIADACHSGSFNSKGETYGSIIETYYSAFNKSKGGFVLMLSSKAEETSIESNGLRQGIFSHFFIKGLKGAANFDKDSIVTVDELFKYVHNNVRFYTNKYQTPVILGEFDGKMPMSVVRKQ